MSNLINSSFAKGHQQIWEGPIAYHTFVEIDVWQNWDASLKEQWMKMTYVHRYDLKVGVAIWEGPIADLMFVQWLIRNARLLHVSYCGSFRDGLCVVHKFRKIISWPSHKFFNYPSFEPLYQVMTHQKRFLDHLSSQTFSETSSFLAVFRSGPPTCSGYWAAESVFWLVGDRNNMEQITRKMFSKIWDFNEKLDLEKRKMLDLVKPSHHDLV